MPEIIPVVFTLLIKKKNTTNNMSDTNNNNNNTNSQPFNPSGYAAGSQGGWKVLYIPQQENGQQGTPYQQYPVTPQNSVQMPGQYASNPATMVYTPHQGNGQQGIQYQQFPVTPQNGVHMPGQWVTAPPPAGAPSPAAIPYPPAGAGSPPAILPAAASHHVAVAPAAAGIHFAASSDDHIKAAAIAQGKRGANKKRKVIDDSLLPDELWFAMQDSMHFPEKLVDGKPRSHFSLDIIEGGSLDGWGCTALARNSNTGKAEKMPSYDRLLIEPNGEYYVVGVEKAYQIAWLMAADDDLSFKDAHQQKGYGKPAKWTCSISKFSSPF